MCQTCSTVVVFLKSQIYIEKTDIQDVEADKAGKVMNDIVSTMFNSKFIDEIFTKHQPLYSR